MNRYSQTEQNSPPITSLLKELRGEVSDLFRDTAALLRQELTENAKEAQTAAAGMLVRTTLLGIGFIFLVAGIDVLIASLLSPTLMSFQAAICVTTLSIGIIMTVGGYILTRKHADKLNPERFVPQRTLETLEEHGEWFASKAEDLVK